MRLFGKILGYGFLIVVVLAVVGISFTIGWRPFLGPKARPLTDRKFAAAPERLARGKYLAENVANCMACHGPHDWTQHDAPMLPGTEGSGAVMPEAGLPGTVYAPNLTPDPETGAGTWTDDQLARAIREGIGHDGRTLFPVMPYERFREMPDEDLASVVVFLRSLPPVRNPMPKTEIIFPVKYLIRSVPEPVTGPVPAADLSIPVKRGEFLVKMADCQTCHTPPDPHGQPLPGMDFAGGWVFEGAWGKVATANITPDASGISYYDEDLFVQTMRTGYVKTRKLSQIMPWSVYRGMTDDDLKSIFAFLRTIKPISHHVDNTETATICPICKFKHGYGEKNSAAPAKP
jgi:mono/diheme cytochrome c family protein